MKFYTMPPKWEKMENAENAYSLGNIRERVAAAAMIYMAGDQRENRTKSETDFVVTFGTEGRRGYKKFNSEASFRRYNSLRIVRATFSLILIALSIWKFSELDHIGIIRAFETWWGKH